MKINWRTILVHLFFWVLYIVIWGVRDMAYAPTFLDTINGNIISSLIFSLGVYPNFYVLIPMLLLKNKKLLYAGAFLFTTIIISLIGSQVFAIYYMGIHQGTAEFFATTQGMASIGGDFLVVQGMATCLYFINEWYVKEGKLRELENRNLKAELDLLKGQVNPHFLFNALNSVHVLIRKDPEKAQATLERFSDLLSHQIYNVRDEAILLSEEIQNTENYVQIQKMRFENYVDVSWKVQGKVNGQMIAPMLFLNFIENAFKHGESQGDKPVEVDISLKVTPESVEFNCNNSAQAKPEGEGRLGVGIANVKRRLALIYPKRHELTIEHKPDMYSVNLQVDLGEN